MIRISDEDCWALCGNVEQWYWLVATDWYWLVRVQRERLSNRILWLCCSGQLLIFLFWSIFWRVWLRCLNLNRFDRMHHLRCSSCVNSAMSHQLDEPAVSEYYSPNSLKKSAVGRHSLSSRLGWLSLVRAIRRACCCYQLDQSPVCLTEFALNCFSSKFN